MNRWSGEKANEWYEKQPWLVGCNFIPSNAINQLEMWQAETFDAVTIERELGWAEEIGFNCVRTYLHDLAWEVDAEGLKRRIDQFLGITAKHGIRAILVFFDDCWNGNSKIGKQPEPRAGVHNSGWVQSPGLKVVNRGQAAWGRLEKYVKDVIGAFSQDERILLWDLYNEPGNRGNGARSLPLVKAVFGWAREANPCQPVSAGIWCNNQKLNDFQLNAADIITFHNYNRVENLEKQIAKLKTLGRPLICTEWMARTRGSLVSSHLPVFAREKVGCLNWGLVAGKTNTMYDWYSTVGILNPRRWLRSKNASVPEPKVWFHDLLRADGTPYDAGEIEVFRKLISDRKNSLQPRV